MTQQQLPFLATPKRPTKAQAIDSMNREAAVIVLSQPQVYGEGLVRWALLFLARDREANAVEPAR